MWFHMEMQRKCTYTFCMNLVTNVAVVRNVDIISGNFSVVGMFGSVERNDVQKRDLSKLLIL